MKLNLTHLAPYLPYGIKLRRLNKYEQPKIIYMNNGNIMDCIENPDICKPVLRFMSDLTKSELIESGFDSHIDYLTHELQNPDNKCRLRSDGKPLWRVESAPYEMVEYLFRNHYDVFDLIKKGLAVDSNTLK